MRSFLPAFLFAATLVGIVAGPAPSQAQLFPGRQGLFGNSAVTEAQIVESATQVLDEVMVEPGKSIPQSLLAEAEGIAIIPSMLKGGFVIGVKHGRGVVVVRDRQRTWQPPKFVTINGGSVGWQAGIQQSDLILVFRTPRSIDSLMKGKLTIGADAAAAAGPVGRQAAAATDVSLQAEIYSYSRSRGLFAGLALDGSVMQLDPNATTVYYTTATPVAGEFPAPGVPAPFPPTADRLLQRVNAYTNGAPTPATTVPAPDGFANNPNPAYAPPPPPTQPSVRRDWGANYTRLQQLLDEEWREYLALPANVLDPSRAGAPIDLTPYLQRYERVARDPAFRSLAEQPDFQVVIDQLRQAAASRSRPGLALPPPPR